MPDCSASLDEIILSAANRRRRGPFRKVDRPTTQRQIGGTGQTTANWPAQFRPNTLAQPIEERSLTRQHRRSRLGKRHPAGRIDFRERSDKTAPRRPFQFEVIAGDLWRVNLLLERECFHDLAACLANGAEGLQHADEGNAKLLLGLAPRRAAT